MSDVLIYTANFGGYDRVLPQHAQDIAVDWLCFTDDPSFVAPAPWRAVLVEKKHAHPNLASKVYKALPPWERGDWSTAIWIDANMEIMEPAFAREAPRYLHDGVATWAHPRRDCVYDEGEMCLPGAKEAQAGRYRNLPIAEQLASYRAEGYPEHNGLIASGTVVWTRDGEPLGKAWLAECERWGFQDQLAFNVVAWRMGVQPGVFGVGQIERRYSPRTTRRSRERGDPIYLANRWLRIHPHAREPYP